VQGPSVQGKNIKKIIFPLVWKLGHLDVKHYFFLQHSKLTVLSSLIPVDVGEIISMAHPAVDCSAAGNSFVSTIYCFQRNRTCAADIGSPISHELQVDGVRRSAAQWRVYRQEFCESSA